MMGSPEQRSHLAAFTMIGAWLVVGLLDLLPLRVGAWVALGGMLVLAAFEIVGKWWLPKWRKRKEAP